MENNQNIKGTIDYIAVILTIMLIIQLGIIGGIIFYLNEMHIIKI